MKKYPKILSAIFKFVLLAVAVFILITSSVKLYSYNKEKAENKSLAENVVSETSANADVPVSVDFKKLKEENEDIIAWLYSEGTPINYPVVLAEDNSFYLHRQTDGQYAFSGTLFADYRNTGDFSDNNTIIYGHNMKNDTMFGTLAEYRNQEYFNEHPEMYLLTPDKEYKVKFIAGVTESSTSTVYELPLEDEDKENFICELLKRSSFEAEYTFSSNDRFLILSTCSDIYGDARYVLIGVLKEL